MSTDSGTDTCGPLEGNADFYGRGIRIGIYLQWISSWVNLLVDPESAQATYDTNSIFVFAIAVATAVAFSNDAASIELYIMIQFMLGFYSTTLSLIGFRLWLMRPESLLRLKDRVKCAIFSSTQSRNESTPSRIWLYWLVITKWCNKHGAQSRNTTELHTAHDESSRQDGPRIFRPSLLAIISSFKPPRLSWSGVVWRSITACCLAFTNVIFWLYQASSDGRSSQPECDPPIIFFFSKQRLQGPIAVLHLIGAFSILVLVYYVAVFFTHICQTVVISWLCSSMLRQLLHWTVPKMELYIQRSLAHIIVKLEKIEISLKEADQLDGRAVVLHMSRILFLGYWMDLLRALTNVPLFSDIGKVLISVGSERLLDPTEDRRVQHDKNPEHIGPIYKLICLGWNIFLALVIAMFIVSIECTIRWNDIQGVNTINTTGQLIPFIMGCVSASQAVKKSILFACKMAYPNWAKVKFELVITITGVIFVSKTTMNEEASYVETDDTTSNGGNIISQESRSQGPETS